MVDAIKPLGQGPYAAGLFADEASFVAACRAARAEGRTDLQAWSPWPVHGLEEVLGLDRSLIGRAVFTVIVLGWLFCFALQFHLQVIDWPVVYGGKPYAAWQLWVVPILETGLLFGAIVNLNACFFTCRLLPDPFTVLPDPRLSDDRFALALAGTPAELAVWFKSHGADSVIAVEVEDVLAEPVFAPLAPRAGEVRAQEQAHA
jgi:hypothetical protein